MKWDVHETHSVTGGDGPVAYGRQPSVGDTVRLTSESHEFEVLVSHVDDNGCQGKVVLIGPDAAISAIGVSRGDTVVFGINNIQHLKWPGGGDA